MSSSLGKRQRVTKDDSRALSSSRTTLVSSSLETAIDDLEVNGYVWLRGIVPKALCERCAKVIQEDVGRRIDEGSKHQEEPIERLDAKTGEIMVEVRDFVINSIFNDKLGLSATVPERWTDTLYGRVKRRHFHTKWHCDAFNTVFQRCLLRPENLQEGQKVNPKWDEFVKTGKLEGSWKDIPIFTFWIALTPVNSKSTSHLRIWPASHRLPNITLCESMKNVVPGGFGYSAKRFLGPPFPGGYEVGDIVVFHCLTQHEANVHLTKDKGSKVGERISMDGRFFYEL